MEVLILQRATLPDIEAVHQREGEEEGKALFGMRTVLDDFVAA